LREINSLKKKSVAIISAENTLALCKARAKADSIKVLQEAEAYCVKQHAIADNKAQILRSNAATRLEVAKNKSSALIKEANAETNNSSKMEGMRRHKEKMMLASSF